MANQPRTFENCKIIMRNFSGEATQYTAEGLREFALVVESPLADQLAAEGWNVKTFKDDPEGIKFIKVAVSYKLQAPVAVLIMGGIRRPLTIHTIGELDHVDIQNVDMTVYPSSWSMRGETCLKAYFKAIYVTAR